MTRLLLVLALGGCVSVTGLEHSAARHDRRAKEQAELGNGPAAAYETNQAVSDREAARRHAEQRGHYWESEVLMQ